MTIRDKTISEHAKRKCAILTSDEKKAYKLMRKIESEHNSDVVAFSYSPNVGYIAFEDGFYVRWLRPVESVRGYKFGTLYMDEQLDKDILRTTFGSSYFGEYKDIVWV